MKRLRIAVAQFNAHVGDLAGNAARILEFASRARDGGADVLLTPELGLSGYPPEDLLMRPDFYRACAEQLDAVARAAGLPIVIGYPEESAGKRYNAASLLAGGRVAATYRKHRLPNYEVFDEERYFAAGQGSCVIELNGVNCGLVICADVWESGATEAAAQAGAELMLTLNASPFHMNKQARRYEVLRERVAATGMPVIYANLVGGQDELVFDGASFALDGQGRLTHQLPAFAEALEFIDYADGHLLSGRIIELPSREAEVYAALKLGVTDYLGKNGFPGAIIGLSGGIDSALTLAIAVDALGADKVRAVMMPSPWTAQMSLDDSREMVKRLGVQYDEIPIADAMEQFAVSLAPTFASLGPKPAWDTTDENLQARIRGMLLMALSNRTGRIVLTTGNKSEMAVGYATLYGDMAGGFAPIKDCTKTRVYALARHRNSLGAVIPDRVISRAPSAELRPDQKDSDSLPPYAVLDPILDAFLLENRSVADIARAGLDPAVVARVLEMVRRAEYKRRQAAPGVRISSRAFGRDWRYPITSGYRHT